MGRRVNFRVQIFFSSVQDKKNMPFPFIVLVPAAFAALSEVMPFLPGPSNGIVHGLYLCLRAANDAVKADQQAKQQPDHA